MSPLATPSTSGAWTVCGSQRPLNGADSEQVEDDFGLHVPCEGCGAEKYEPCHPDCLSEVWIVKERE